MAQLADFDSAWSDATFDADSWWRLNNVTPLQAATLLCGLNPEDDTVDPLTVSTDKTSPDDFKRLLREFEDAAQADAKPRTLSQWHDIAITTPLKHHTWIDDYAVAMSSNKTPQAHSGAAKLGLPRKSILTVNWPLIGSFTQESLENALSDVPKWLAPARVAKGARGKGSALWNPTLLAECLRDRGYANQKSLEVFIGQYFPEWLEDWKKHQDYR